MVSSLAFSDRPSSASLGQGVWTWSYLPTLSHSGFPIKISIFQMLRSKYVLLVFGKRMRSSLAFAKLLRPDWWNSLSGPVCEAGELFRSGPK